MTLKMSTGKTIQQQTYADCRLEFSHAHNLDFRNTRIDSSSGYFPNKYTDPSHTFW